MLRQMSVADGCARGQGVHRIYTSHQPLHLRDESLMLSENATLTLALGAYAGGHSGHSGTRPMTSNRGHAMKLSQKSFEHQNSFRSMREHGKSYTKFMANRHFRYDRFGRHLLHYTHRYWSHKYNCWCCWAPDYRCWYFYEPCHEVYVPVTYLAQVYCPPTPVAAPEPSYATSAPVAPASVIQQTTVTNGAPAVAPPPPPVGAD